MKKANEQIASSYAAELVREPPKTKLLIMVFGLLGWSLKRRRIHLVLRMSREASVKLGVP